MDVRGRRGEEVGPTSSELSRDSISKTRLPQHHINTYLLRLSTIPPKPKRPKPANELTLERRIIPELRGEIKRRRLGFKGIRLKSQLIDLEIRLMIWELSLPGPRVLTVSDYRRCSDRQPFLSPCSLQKLVLMCSRLLFPKEDNPPNPAALSTCRESRAVALKRYRLCFGAPNLYADLPGGDILHFGVHWEFCEWVFRDGGVLLNWVEKDGDSHSCDPLTEDFGDYVDDNSWKRCALSAPVVADLKVVKHIAIREQIWQEYSQRITWYSGLNGCDLRIYFEELPTLETVMLVHGGREDITGFYTTPGHNEIEDKLSHLYPPFRETGLSKTEEAEGVPEIKVVKANRMPRIPRDYWELDLGSRFSLPEREEPLEVRQPPSARLYGLKMGVVAVEAKCATKSDSQASRRRGSVATAASHIDIEGSMASPSPRSPPQVSTPT
ncbi:uncharacterized protein PAC_08240 [Phialocephala subalpina]|uniref:2EXR domain-containing protein n=1 Tax=Phialocephala subalpina TaxID=576137 RepID=A0A1L7X001_9HELO|nr:uncharacterized protein PAC_08240 [Phialocephala subalpina]